MADQPKKKKPSEVRRNDSRKNGKASKDTPDAFRGRGKEYRGSHTRGVRLTELQKALLGGGVMRNIDKKVEGSVSGTWSMPWRG